MLDLHKVADDADMIVNGYAFNRCSHGYRVLNLNHPQNAIVLSKSEPKAKNLGPSRL